MSPQKNPQLGLASVVVRVSRECGTSVERLQAETLVRDAQDAKPGRLTDRWFQWLNSSLESLSVRAKVQPLEVEDALYLARDGAVVVGGDGDSGLIVLLGYDGRRAEVAVGEIDQRRWVSKSELIELLAQPGGGQAEGEGGVWVAIEHPAVTDASEARRLPDKPVTRLLRIVKPEWPDIWLILVFAFFAGVLNLATPIAVESLVNTVAFGQLLQPLVVLTTLLLAFLLFAAVMQALQTYVAEIIQRRLFARVAADLAYRLPRVDASKLGARHGPELVNRFLDVVTLQKVVAQLLLDGVSIVLATLVGMAVLAFYHPFLLGFDVLLLILVVSGLWVLGLGGIGTGIYESKQKYRLTSWFEDVMRCQRGLKSGGGADYAIDRANAITANYLKARRTHFSVLFRQIVFILALQAIAGTVLLGAGGWLVIQESLTLGQLVAAELIVTTILASLAKLGKHLEGFYDVVAAVDKLGVLFDLDVERPDGLLVLPSGAGAEVQLAGLRDPAGGPALRAGLTETIAAGERVALLGGRYSGVSGLLESCYGARLPAGGSIEIEGLDPADLRPDALRKHVALVSGEEVFEGSITDNVDMERAEVTQSDIRQALLAVGLLEDVHQMKGGVEAPLSPGGVPLDATQRLLITLARAIAGNPRLLLIDRTIDLLPDADAARVIAALKDNDRPWTVVVGTGRRDIAERFDRTVHLDGAAA